jgi:plastocyanin
MKRMGAPPVGLFVNAGEPVTWSLESGAHSTTAYEKETGSASVTRVPSNAMAQNSGQPVNVHIKVQPNL